MTIQDVTLRVVTLAEKEEFNVPVGALLQASVNVTGGEPNATTPIAGSPVKVTGKAGGGYILFFDGSYLPPTPPPPAKGGAPAAA